MSYFCFNDRGSTENVDEDSLFPSNHGAQAPSANNSTTAATAADSLDDSKVVEDIYGSTIREEEILTVHSAISISGPADDKNYHESQTIISESDVPEENLNRECSTEVSVQARQTHFIKPNTIPPSEPQNVSLFEAKQQMRCTAPITDKKMARTGISSNAEPKHRNPTTIEATKLFGAKQNKRFPGLGRDAKMIAQAKQKCSPSSTLQSGYKAGAAQAEKQGASLKPASVQTATLRSSKWLSYDAEGFIRIHSAAASVFESVEDKLCSFISIFGPARSGKSFLINCLAGDADGSLFNISHGVVPVGAFVARL